MNLHAVVSPIISAVNPNVLLTIQVSTGDTWDTPDGSAAPTYAPPVQVMGQVQNLTYGDIEHIDGLNIQGVRRAVYLNGEVDGLVREKNKGGDLIQLPDGTVWLVAHVLEYWPDWTKAVITLQNDTALPGANQISPVPSSVTALGSIGLIQEVLSITEQNVIPPLGAPFVSVPGGFANIIIGADTFVNGGGAVSFTNGSTQVSFYPQVAGINLDPGDEVIAQYTSSQGLANT